jgi:hypothetical protein
MHSLDWTVLSPISRPCSGSGGGKGEAMRPSASWRRSLLAAGGAAAVLTTVVGPVPRATSAEAAGPGGWRLVHSEAFDRALPVGAVPWTRDPQGDKSPWNVDQLDDDGRYFQVQGGQEFQRQLNSFNVMRKRVSFGGDGWLTAELAARDTDRDGKPEHPPTLSRVSLPGGGGAARIDEPSHDTGLVIRSTRPLPRRYRVEYTLRTISFGGQRNGQWNYDGKANGYGTEGCKTSWPWKMSGDFSGPTNQCNPNFSDVRSDNGFYFLEIMDYANPAPHNNLFIHNHRKVGMDGYNVRSEGQSPYAVCNPRTKETYNYNSPLSSHNGINSIFFDGSRWRDQRIGYTQFLMNTECGSFTGTETNPGTIVSSAEIQPELMPNTSYKFAIERDDTGYTMEMSGNFRHAGPMTLRAHRDFVEDGQPIWHYNNTPQEYDGRFDSTLTFSGPYGSYQVREWPKGSAYPDYFMLGDPHLNFYEGSATVDDIRLYVPAV